MPIGLLEEIGLEIRGDADAIRLWREAGANIKDEWRVRVPQGLAREIVRRSAPGEFTQHARNPARSVTIGGRATVFAPAYGPPLCQRPRRGRRYGTLEDFENFVKLAYLVPWLHHSGGTVCEPTDLPVNKRHLDMLYAHMTLSDKPFMGSVTTAPRAADSIEMCRILFGRRIRRQPLRDPRQRQRQLAAGARWRGEPRHPHLCGGQSGAGLRALHPRRRDGAGDHRGGARAVLCRSDLLRGARAARATGVARDSRQFPVLDVAASGAPTFGTPEPALAYFAIGQLARRLGVPLRCGGNLCASKVPDAQAAYESANSLWPAFLAGANFMLHSAGWLEAGLVMSYEKFVMDVDQCGAFHVLGPRHGAR